VQRRKSSLFISAAVTAMLFSAPALAQPGAGGGAGSATAPTAATGATLGEIVVTAQRRAERQVDVPISITALGPQQLTTANVQYLGDIQRVTPALRFDTQTSFVQPSIRGIGTGITTSGGGSNVGIYIDGFYSPNPIAADFQLTNIQSIQVLKGPQGTLFGRNTTGGAILVTTADPSTTPSFQGKATYGRFNSQRYQAYGTFGLTDKVAMDIEAIYAKGNGYWTNIVDGNDKVGAYTNYTLRTGVKYTPTDNVSVLVRYTHTYSNDPAGQMLNSNTDTTIDPTTGKPWGVQTFTVPGTFTTNPDQIAANLPRYIHTWSDVVQGTVKADLGIANFTSYTQYRQEKTDQSEDLDQTALPIFQLGLPITDLTYSQEFLLTSKPGPRLQWTAGAFFMSNKDSWVTFVDNGVLTPGVGRFRLGGSGTTTQSTAGFVDLTYQAMDKLFITAGVRFSHDVVTSAYFYKPGEFDLGPFFVPSIHSNKATPRFVIRYAPTDQSSVYASYTKGYKAAIIDVGGSCQDAFTNFTCNPVAPEDVNAYEVGYKFDNRDMSLEAAAFYYDYKNLQVSEFLGAAQASIINAAKSKIYGIDVAYHYNMGEHLQFNVGGAWTHARYDTFGTTVNGTVVGAPIYASCPVGPTSPCGQNTGAFDYVKTDTILHDVPMQHTPAYTVNAGARYTTGKLTSGEYSVSGNLYYSSSFFFSPSGTQFFQPGYTTLSLRAQWVDPTNRYMLAVFGDNVTNSRYRTQVQFNGFGIGATWSQPATWGVEGGVKF
jgi:iron complex outermembrane receptor protein